MALDGPNKSDKRKALLKLKIVVERLQRSFALPKRTAWSFCDLDLMMDKYELPEDVKKGHFSVFAVDDGNAKRFVVPLCHLNNPSFLRLLELAAEEFGFGHEGALCLPCRSNELENILGIDGRY